MVLRYIVFVLLLILSTPALAQMPTVDSACPTGSNEGSFAIGDIGSGEIALLVCDDDGASGGVYREWASRTGSGALTVDDLTVTGTCTNCGSGGGGSGPSIPTDVKLSTSTHNGNFGGYGAMQTWVESNGCSGYEICTGRDLAAYKLAGNNLPSGSTVAWVGGGMVGWGQTSGGGKYIYDCLGWTDSSSGEAGPGWQLAASNGEYVYYSLCNTANYVLCCSF